MKIKGNTFAHWESTQMLAELHKFQQALALHPLPPLLLEKRVRHRHLLRGGGGAHLLLRLWVHLLRLLLALALL